ncbi:hypothetical protein [Cytophaga aurantiaca]|uniref:hypothetical protein n=1 Tax=Cytophaga aurantiaca TaxID=29530 RepID=UPI000367FAA0|nr:hypothetical protein [Cytophaga aurantiaca]
MNFKNITIEYHYLDVPAPFCYTKTLKINATETFLQVDYLLTYTDREDFSVEELEEEGFTGDDNESWTGKLDLNWLDSIKQIIALPKGNKASSANECILHVDGKSIETYGNEIQWDYFIQEITQAIYETAAWEQPLTIRFCKKDTDKASIQKLQISFANKTANLNIGEKNSSVEWTTIQQLLKLYYLQEFLEGEHTNKVPNQAGIYTDPSDGSWYDIKNASASLSKEQKETLLKVLEEIFD